MRGTELRPMGELKSIFLLGIPVGLQCGDHSLEGSAGNSLFLLCFYSPGQCPHPGVTQQRVGMEGSSGVSPYPIRRGWECPAPQENSVGKGADLSPLQGMGITPCSGGEMQNSSALEVSSTALPMPTLPKL